MRNNKHWWVVLVAFCLTIGIVGCNGSDGDQGNGGAAADPDTPNDNGTAPDQATDGSADPQTPAAEPPAPITYPKVRLTAAHRETCILDVGQTMPEAELPGLDGQVHPLRPLYGEKLTVVCFWGLGSTPMSWTSAGYMLEDLIKDVVEPYADQGVRVLAVNEGNSAQDIGALKEKTGVDVVQTLPIFLDPDGALFNQVAHEKLPRIYAIDAEGKVLWFDIEYSEITRDDLLQTIQVALGEI